MRFNKFIFIKILNYSYVKVKVTIKVCRENAFLNFFQAGPNAGNGGPPGNIASILGSISLKGINDSKFNK